MAKPETIRVELSAADRRLLQRVVDALERAHPKSVAYRNHPAGTRLTEASKRTTPLTWEQIFAETNPRLMEHLLGDKDA